jgi:transcriptional regulator with XRE-family HTH domain
MISKPRTGRRLDRREQNQTEDRAYAAIVGSVVRLYRNARGISLTAMARMMGLSTSGWSRVETGDTVMVVAQLRKAARHLKLEPHEIVRVADDLYETVLRVAEKAP